MDLGATRWTTFRLVTLPNLASALLAGGLLAFALSFDEIVVTTFTAPPTSRRCRSGSTPTCSAGSRRRSSTSRPPRLILLSLIPIFLTQKLSGDRTGGRL